MLPLHPALNGLARIVPGGDYFLILRDLRRIHMNHRKLAVHHLNTFVYRLALHVSSCITRGPQKPLCLMIQFSATSLRALMVSKYSKRTSRSARRCSRDLG